MTIEHFVKSALKWTTRKGSSGNPIVDCENTSQV
jgi:hypothetical protein